MPRTKHKGTPQWKMPKSAAGWARFLDRMERERDRRKHRIEVALNQAFDEMFGLDDMRHDLEDAENLPDLRNPERGKPLLTAVQYKMLRKRVDALEEDLEKWDEQSDHYDALNTWHSDLVGIN